MEKIENALAAYRAARDAETKNGDWRDLHGNRIDNHPSPGSASFVVWCMCESGLDLGWSQTDVKRAMRARTGAIDSTTHKSIHRWSKATGKRLRRFGGR